MKVLPLLVVHVRHGEALRDGYSDRHAPLTEQGKKAMRQTVYELFDRFGYFDYVFHSEFARSAESAEILRSFYGGDGARTAISAVFQKTALLNERDRGDAADVPREEWEERFPEFYREWRAVGEMRAEYPGGERLIDVIDRTRLFLHTFNYPRYESKRVCIMGHWGTHFALLHLIGGITDEGDLLAAMGKESPGHCAWLSFAPDKARSGLMLTGKNLGC